MTRSAGTGAAFRCMRPCSGTSAWRSGMRGGRGSRADREPGVGGAGISRHGHGVAAVPQQVELVRCPVCRSGADLEHHRDSHGEAGEPRRRDRGAGCQRHRTGDRRDPPGVGRRDNISMCSKAILALCLPFLAAAADKGPPTAQAGNDSVTISATLYQGKDAVRQLLGSDLGGYFLVVKLEMTPKGPKPLAIDRDDFLLRSYNDGQKCQPYAPSQIAGRASLAVVPVGGGEVSARQGGPVFGAPGMGGQRLPGQEVGVGSTNGPPEIQAKVDDTSGAKDDPLLKLLKAKI